MRYSIGVLVVLVGGWSGASILCTQAAPAPQATAPDAIIARTIQDMQDGESGFTVPEALIVDTNKRCWLDPLAPISSTTTVLKITKNKDGLHLIVTQSDVRWPRIRQDQVDKTLLPVRTITVTKGPTR